jgi:S-adenosylmethionine hydrolase
MKPRIIALLTDFGIYDPYVGIMKAVMSEIASDASLIDLSHQIPAGDIQRGAYVLWQAARDFPPGSIFLSVVDPGVGTIRKGIILQTEKHIFVGPDNGLFSYLLIGNNYQAWELANPNYQRQGISTTFHGRDIFAPAAAFAAQGIQGKEFGAEIKDLINLSKPALMRLDPCS